jgi:beta-N-acetylhexosaminidase
MSGMADGLTDGMTLEQQIGQLLMVGFPETTPSADVLDLIATGHVGGIVFFARNIASARQTFELTSSLQAAARAAQHPAPLLIALDQENGVVWRTGTATTHFPGGMALGAIGSEEIAEAIARATGEELRALGITMNFAPVVDTANNPANPVIGVRSFGADPALVGRLGAATVRGSQAAGVIATLKHFPGHGDTAVDSHLGLPVLPFARERLQRLELPPFRQGIAAGAEAVMTAHVALPAITGSSETPATLSADVLRGLLRHELGFAGVIITDCLEMNAISEGIGIADGAVAALRAGADIVLVSHRADRQRAALAAIAAAVRRGDLSPDAITVAAERVLRLKQRLPSWEQLPDAANAATLAALNVLTTPEHAHLAEDAYARSITLARDETGQLPLALAGAGRMLVVAQQRTHLAGAIEGGFNPDDLVAALRHRFGGRVAEVGLSEIPAEASAADLEGLRQRASQAEVALLATCNAHRAENIANAQAIVRSLLDAGRPVIGVAVCEPYDAAALPQVGSWLASYDFTPPALDAVARLLAGDVAPSGRLPVAL